MTAEANISEDRPAAPPKRLIGSQRNPEAYRPKPGIQITGEETSALKTESYPPEESQPDKIEKTPKLQTEEELNDELPNQLSEYSEENEKSLQVIPLLPTQRIQIPKIRAGKLSDDLEDEFNAIFAGQSGGESFDALIDQSSSAADQGFLEPETKLAAKVLAVQNDSVFLDIGVREQGVVSLKMFPPEEEPKQGQTLNVTVVRFMPDEGLYDVSVPLAAADVRDWSQVHEGMIVEARITKTNSGGLECEVNRLRGFIPISQIELFRVENLEQYVGQKLTCIVEEVNPERRNLVLSRRTMLNREREEKRTALFAELEVGQIREGLVRKIIDVGAFVDLGGVDGFIPIGAISWGRIHHPSDVLSEGTRVKVRISKIDEAGNRISLVYRDDASNPWSNILERFQEKTLARGKVSRIMDFGAFIELMPGVEGLVHISELSNKRVGNVREVVKEGEWVDVYILSIDSAAKRMSLSIKQAAPTIEEQEVTPEISASEASIPEHLRPPVKVKNSHKGPLKGGTDNTASGEQFGLKW